MNLNDCFAMYAAYKSSCSPSKGKSDSFVEEPFQDLMLDEDQSGGEETEPKPASWRDQLSKSEKKQLHREKLRLANPAGVTKKSAAEMNSAENDGKGIKKTFPNYLIAMQITNPEIYAAVQRLQEHVVSQNENLVPSLQPIGLMHFSLFMTRLDTDDEVTRAKRALDQCKLDLQPLYQDNIISLDIAGLDNFRDKVVFAKLKTEDQESRLRGVADTIERCFNDQGIVSATDHGFTAHATVINLSRDKNSKRKGGVKRIDPALYKEYVDADFGHQYVNSLQLCPMMKPKLKSGYYDVEYTVQFGPDITKGNSKVVALDHGEGSEKPVAPDFGEGSEITCETAEKILGTKSRNKHKTAAIENSATGSSPIKTTDIKEHSNFKIPDSKTEIEDDPDFEYHSKMSWC